MSKIIGDPDGDFYLG